MNTTSLDLKKEINVNIQVKATLEAFVLSDFIKEYKKLRPIGTNNVYYLLEIPRPFVNGAYDCKRKYSLQLAFNKKNNHKLILVDLDDNLPILSENNRRKLINFPKNEKKEGGV